MSLFEYDFMIRALIGALVIGLAAPALGIYLVQRRLSLIGDGIGHVALTGVGVGLLLHHSPVISEPNRYCIRFALLLSSESPTSTTPPAIPP